MKEFIVASAWPNKFFAKSKSRLKVLLPKEKNDKTYIFPTKFGFAFGTLCLILIYSSFATGNNLMYMYMFFLTSIGFTSLWLTHVNIVDVKIESVEVEDTFADSPAHASVQLYNHGRRHRSFIRAYLDKNEITQIEVIGPKTARQVRIGIGTFPRGTHRLPRITLDTLFPFFLLNSWKVWRPTLDFTVFPKREGFSQLPYHQTLGETEEGRTIDRVRTSDSEFTGHRKFESSDSSRHIDWKAFARTERLLVKDYQGFQPQEIQITEAALKTEMDFEKKISQMALWIEIAESKGFFYSFKLGKHFFPSDRGRTHYIRCLKTLADAQPAGPAVPT